MRNEGEKWDWGGNGVLGSARQKAAKSGFKFGARVALFDACLLVLRTKYNKVLTHRVCAAQRKTPAAVRQALHSEMDSLMLRLTNLGLSEQARSKWPPEIGREKLLPIHGFNGESFLLFLYVCRAF